MVSAVIWASSFGVKLESGTVEIVCEFNVVWFEDMCVCLLCILVFDCFGDFVGDGVVVFVCEMFA